MEHTYSTVYFNSLIKTVINQRYHLNDSFEEILNTLDAWINESSAWTIDQIDGLYINTSNYEPLSGSNYIPLPEKLKNSMKGLISKIKIINVLRGVMLDLLILQIATQKE